MRTFAIALAAVALAGCGGQDNTAEQAAERQPVVTLDEQQQELVWAYEFSREFIQGCVDSGGSRAQCECAIHTMLGRYEREEVLEVAANARDPRAREILASCA